MRRPVTTLALVGVDGSGKSSQAQRLAQALRRDGQAARSFENPGGRPLLDGVARRLGRADGAALLGTSGRLAVEGTVRWTAIARAHLVARSTGSLAVMDRYVLCQHAIMRARGDRPRPALTRALAVFPDPTLTVWLRVPPAVAQRRVAERGYDRESLEYLSALDAAYEALTADVTRLVVLDADRPADDVHADLREIADAALRPVG